MSVEGPPDFLVELFGGCFSNIMQQCCPTQPQIISGFTNVVNNFKEIVSIASTKPSEAADQRNVIVMMLPNSDVVNAVLFSEGGALETCAPNSLFVDMSTGSYPKMMKIAKNAYNISVSSKIYKVSL